MVKIAEINEFSAFDETDIQSAPIKNKPLTFVVISALCAMHIFA